MSGTPVEFVVASSHPCLPGHFPGRPLVPGVVILEQVIVAIQSAHGPMPSLRLPQVKFLRPLRPGEHARVELEGRAPRWRFRVLRGDELVASGELAVPA